jgi:hypothetical protein
MVTSFSANQRVLGLISDAIIGLLSITFDWVWVSFYALGSFPSMLCNVMITDEECTEKSVHVRTSDPE